MPKRVQMTRQRPWRANHPDAVIVARPTRWGNPITAPLVAWWAPEVPAAERLAFAAEEFGRFLGIDDTPSCRVVQPPVMRWTAYDDALRAARVETFTYPTRDEIRAALAGRDLACWCPLDQPCHADVLLELANEPHDAADETEQHDGEAGEEDEGQHEFAHGARRTGTGPGASREPGSAA